MAESSITRRIGLEASPCVGLKVKISKEGEDILKGTEIGQASKGLAGYITKIHPEHDAVMVHWDVSDIDEESGWYRTGAYGQYTLELFDLANSETEIQLRGWAVDQDISFDNLIHLTPAGCL